MSEETSPMGFPPIGGKVAPSGPKPGNYHTKVTGVETAVSQETGRMGLTMEFFVHDDPNHPAKEGKRLTKDTTWFPMPITDDMSDEEKEKADDAEKQATMMGMVKKNLYDAFGIEWPETPTTDFDQREWLDKECWVQVTPVEDKRTPGTYQNKITSRATEEGKLPKLKLPKEPSGDDDTEEEEEVKPKAPEKGKATAAKASEKGGEKGKATAAKASARSR